MTTLQEDGTVEEMSDWRECDPPVTVKDGWLTKWEKSERQGLYRVKARKIYEYRWGSVDMTFTEEIIRDVNNPGDVVTYMLNVELDSVVRRVKKQEREAWDRRYRK